MRTHCCQASRHVPFAHLQAKIGRCFWPLSSGSATLFCLGLRVESSHAVSVTLLSLELTSLFNCLLGVCAQMAAETSISNWSGQVSALLLPPTPPSTQTPRPAALLLCITSFLSCLQNLGHFWLDSCLPQSSLPSKQARLPQSPIISLTSRPALHPLAIALAPPRLSPKYVLDHPSTFPGVFDRVSSLSLCALILPSLVCSTHFHQSVCL